MDFQETNIGHPRAQPEKTARKACLRTIHNADVEPLALKHIEL
jgi:hypothetical protein